MHAQTNARAGKCALTQMHAYANARTHKYTHTQVQAHTNTRTSNFRQIEPALSNVASLFATFSFTGVSVVLHFNVSDTSVQTKFVEVRILRRKA